MNYSGIGSEMCFLCRCWRRRCCQPRRPSTWEWLPGGLSLLAASSTTQVLPLLEHLSIYNLQIHLELHICSPSQYVDLVVYDHHVQCQGSGGLLPALNTKFGGQHTSVCVYQVQVVRCGMMQGQSRHATASVNHEHEAYMHELMLGWCRQN